jgi:hypothetical protein
VVGEGEFLTGKLLIAPAPPLPTVIANDDGPGTALVPYLTPPPPPPPAPTAQGVLVGVTLPPPPPPPTTR